MDQVQTELQQCGALAVLDLEEVNLADVAGVRFLNACEAKGIAVEHRSPYIREWMSRERPRETAGGKRTKRQISSEDEHGDLE